VADAKNKLPELRKAVEDGETITICRRGVPVADIVRTAAPAGKTRKLGTLRDKIQIHDPDCWKPMTEEEVDAFLEGRYQVRFLLGTAALIFAMKAPERLGERAVALFADPDEIPVLSAVSVSEIAIKAGRGKLGFSLAEMHQTIAGSVSSNAALHNQACVSSVRFASSAHGSLRPPDHRASFVRERPHRDLRRKVQSL